MTTDRRTRRPGSTRRRSPLSGSVADRDSALAVQGPADQGPGEAYPSGDYRTDTQLSQADLSQGAAAGSGAELSQAQFSHAHAGVARGHATGGEMAERQFAERRLAERQRADAEMAGADLTGPDLTDADLTDADWDLLEEPREVALAGAVRLAAGGRRTLAPAGGGPGHIDAATAQRVRPAGGHRVSGGRTRRPDRPDGTLLSRRSPGWPLQALLVGFPLWWALGLGIFIFPILAVPMLVQLRRRAPVRFPPLFWVWVLYLVWQVLSLAMFNSSPPGTHAGAAGGRLASITLNYIQFAGITVTLVYVGNLSLREVPQRVIARWMGWFFLTVTAGGFLGVIAPHFSFTSPVEALLPHRVVSNIYIRSLVHPIAAQVQNVIGARAGRPAAPFGYTNYWGNAIGILIIWFVAGWIIPARPRLRLVYSLIALAAFIPIFLSLNRGLWLGLIFLVAFVAFRLLLRGHIGLMAAVIGFVAVAGLVVISTPLQGVVQARLNNGNSNSIRSYVATQSIEAVKHSPILGYGGTRHTDGSASSITVGKTANCAQCGDVATGSTGALWAVLFNQGIGGALLYFGFFAGSLWIYRRERTAVDEAALATIALLFVFMFFYNALPAAPTLTMIAVAVLWRSRDQRLAGGLGKGLAGGLGRPVRPVRLVVPSAR